MSDTPEVPIRISCTSGVARVIVKTISLDKDSKAPVMILTDANELMYLPIWIGKFEADAILAAMEGNVNPRPMTYDLFRSALDAFSAIVLKATITELKETTYYARLLLSRDGKEIDLDSRPSDAIAMALRFNAPIFVAESVLQSASIPDKVKCLSLHPDGQVILG